MITGELKNKVDQLWSRFWTGGISNPIEVLSQMTYLFYMKMLDDKQIKDEQNANAFGFALKDPIFPDGEWHNPESGLMVPYKDMRWQNFRNMGATNMFRMIRENVFVFIKNIGFGSDSAYSRFMSNAIFFIPNEHVLQEVVDGIDALSVQTTDKDIMGDIYEYCMGKMESSGVNGQFRTPRHVIRMVVELMRPTPKDIMCDPAVGTAGFMVEGAKYIKSHYQKELMDKSVYNHFQNNLIHGYDTDQTMLRIAAMNLMLQDVVNPQINQMDSVSADNTDEGEYTLVMANPPFTGSVNKNTINPKLSAMVKTPKTELLFICQFIRSLKLGGRCASVVPDGVLFGSSTAHKAVRKEIIDNQCLNAVISMPSGVFKPYAGVSTAILIFTRTDAGGTDKVWFYDMKADGFSLDDKRNPIADNDIPDIISRYHNLDAETSRSRKEQSFFVSVDDIRANDYDLSINKYKEVERVKVEYEPVSKLLKQLDTLEDEYTKGYSRLAKMLEE